MIIPNETWQVEVGGQIYETNFEELVNWISEGNLMRADKVRRGNLRWLEAGKIPTLDGFFNAKDFGHPLPSVEFSTTIVGTETAVNTATPANNFATSQQNTTQFAQNNQPNDFNNLPPTQMNLPPTQMFAAQPFENPLPLPTANVCFIHNDTEPKYVCDTCQNVFCAACPKSFGGSLRICPMCGSSCSSIQQLQAQWETQIQYQTAMSEGFGLEDFGKAIVYPFKFKLSLFFGAILFTFFSLGQTAAGAGSFMMIGPVLICFMLANMLTFSVLANTVENFSQGKIDKDFMSNFDDFSLWMDVIQPFFLSIGVFLVSFGLMTVLIFASMLFMWSSVKDSVKKESDIRMEQVKKQKEELRKSKQPSIMDSDRDRAYQADLDNMNKQIGIQKLRSLGMSDPEADLSFEQTLALAFKSIGLFIIPIFLALLWGLFYYPIACAVAGYSRSFAATINPSIGWETIKLLGADYAKIVVMTLFLSIIVALVELVIHFVLSSFDMPGMGNLPAIALGSIVKFYFSVVFAVILGFALYKNADKLKFSLN